MSAAADALTTLHLIVQTGFLAVTLLLLLVTAVNRLRIRRVLLSWQKGRLFGLPVWPAAFLGGVLCFFGGAYATGHALPLLIFMGYLVGGVFWLVASLLADTVLVTDYGILQNTHHADQMMAWGQVVDYFETPAGRHHRYVFFYLDPTEARSRLELTVPRTPHAAFARIVHDKLDRRFDLSAAHAQGKKALG